jgi:hypothetical protein
VAIVTLDDLPRAALRRKDGGAAAPFRLGGRLQGVLHRGDGRTEPLDDARAVVEWDGSTLTVWRRRWFGSNERIFAGR